MRLIILPKKHILKEKVDVNEFERKDQYQFFSEFDISFYSVTTQIYVKEIVAFARKHRISLYGLFTYIILKANNEVPNFAYRRDGNDIYKYNRVDASCAMIKDNNVQYTNRLVFNDRISEFMKEFIGKKDEIEKGKKKSNLYEDNNLVYITVLPWFRMKNVTNIRMKIRDDTIPRFSWGKIYGNEEWVDLVVEVSHLFIDGYHISLLIDKINEIILDLEKNY